MARIKLKYVNGFSNRDRKSKRVRYYFRRRGMKAIPLPGVPGSEEFVANYSAALASIFDQHAEIAANRRLDKRRPRRTAPSKRREKLKQVANNARRLLKSLGINDPDEAADGPGDPEIFQALVLIGERNANPVMEATRRIGRLVEIVEGTAGAAEFDRRARKATTEIAEVGKLTVRQGNPGDDAVNEWITAMMAVYRARRVGSQGPRWTQASIDAPRNGQDIH